MTSNEGVDKVTADLSKRAKAILEEGHKESDIMKSAFADFKSLGSLTGLMAVATTGKLNKQQMELVQRIAVKVIAVLGIMESL